MAPVPDNRRLGEPALASSVSRIVPRSRFRLVVTPAAFVRLITNLPGSAASVAAPVRSKGLPSPKARLISFVNSCAISLPVSTLSPRTLLGINLVKLISLGIEPSTSIENILSRVAPVNSAEVKSTPAEPFVRLSPSR